MTKPRQPIQPPKNQSFEGGFSITMTHYVPDAKTGDRTHPVGRKSARFQFSHQMSEYYEQNRFRKFKRRATKSPADSGKATSDFASD